MNRLRSSSNIQSVKSGVKPWKWPSIGKENRSSTVKCVLAVSQAEQVVKGVKENATRTMSNVKQSFDNFSQKLRRSTRKRRRPSELQAYDALENKVTPVKLYSPFGIETPSPDSATPVKSVTPAGRHLTPKKFNFVSPTGKFKKDVDDLSNGLRELNTFAARMKSRSK